MKFQFCSSSFFSFFFSVMHNSKTIQCMWMVYISNDCSANGDHSYLFWAVCELWLVNYSLKTVSKTLCVLVQTFIWLLTVIVCILGMGHSQATPGLLNACVTGCEFARNSVYVEVWLLFSLLTCSTWRVFSPAGDAYAYIYITCECLQCDSILGGEDKNVILPIFGGEYVWGGLKFERNLITSGNRVCLQCDIVFGGE